MSTLRTYHFDNGFYDPESGLITFSADDNIHLEPIATKLLNCLIKYSGNPVSYDLLLTEVWGENACVSNSTITSHISRLRKTVGKLSNDKIISSVYGRGYMFSDAALTAADGIEEVKSKSEQNDLSSDNPTRFTMVSIVAFALISLSIYLYSMFPSSKPIHFSDSAQLTTSNERINGFDIAGNYMFYTTHGGNLYRFNFANGKTNHIIDGHEADLHSPTVLSDSVFALVALNDKGCNVVLYDRKEYKSINKFDCGHSQAWTPIGAAGEDLYFTYQAAASTPSFLQKINLSTLAVTQLSPNNITAHGDFSFKLSPDLKKVAVLRHAGSRKVSIRVIELEGHKVITEIELDNLLFNVDWLDKDSIVYRSGNSLLAYNVEKSEYIDIHYDFIESVHPRIVDDNLYFMKGEYVKKGLGLLNSQHLNNLAVHEDDIFGVTSYLNGKFTDESVTYTVGGGPYTDFYNYALDGSEQIHHFDKVKTHGPVVDYFLVDGFPRVFASTSHIHTSSYTIHTVGAVLSILHYDKQNELIYTYEVIGQNKHIVKYENEVSDVLVAGDSVLVKEESYSVYNSSAGTVDTYNFKGKLLESIDAVSHDADDGEIHLVNAGLLIHDKDVIQSTDFQGNLLDKISIPGLVRLNCVNTYHSGCSLELFKKGHPQIYRAKVVKPTS